MAIDLQNPTNIATGWGRPPDFSAPNIGGMVGDILKNRTTQQALQQKEIADAIKQYQQGRGGAAFIKAAQSANLLPQGDLGDLGSQGPESAAALAKLIKDSQQTSQEKYYDALTNILNKTGNLPGRPGGSQSTKIWIPELNGYGTPDQAFQVRKTQADLLGKQAGEIAGQQEDYGFGDNVPAGFGYMKNPDGSLRYAATTEEQAKPDVVSPVDVLTGPGKEQLKKGLIDKETGQPLTPFFTPDVYKQRQQQSALRQKILGQQQDVQTKMLTPPVGSGAGGGGGPNDAAISQANQIKADFQAGKIDADQARAQIQALNIPGFQ